MIPTENGITYETTNFEKLKVIQPVVINSNVELDVYAQNNNLTGNGTKDFPFVIDSVLINASNSDFAVSNTKITKYLTIKSS